MKENHADILSEIKNSGKIEDSTKSKLENAIKEFKAKK